ncbi:hypothetical protein [Reyranella soli]|uniref:Uncharacterized protein n=1 Tax=Reyranella soli TaxID=1230389 RepID=A0A512NTA1_9HYPH|nr:hypothetical protein [Reyranella soli]GEP62151.1 hypothetical protein RSO01_93170 [Reyranella soli]
MATLYVGAEQADGTITAAAFAALDGNVLAVRAGSYVNGLATISKDITIVATMSYPTTLSAGIDMAAAGNSAAAQSGGTATVAIASAVAHSRANLQNEVVAHG